MQTKIDVAFRFFFAVEYKFNDFNLLCFIHIFSCWALFSNAALLLHGRIYNLMKETRKYFNLFNVYQSSIIHTLANECYNLT